MRTAIIAQRVCLQCNKFFECPIHFLKFHAMKFCSKRCYHGYRSKPLREILNNKTVKTESCWLWAGQTSKGYGVISLRAGGKYRKKFAHRIAYELAYGRIPEGLLVCHKCDNPACVRPDHLWLGTNDENMADMKAKGRAGMKGRTPVKPFPKGTDNYCYKHRETRFGSLNPAAKLASGQVLEIRNMYSEGGISQKALALRFNVSQSLISLIIQGKLWASLA